MGITILVGTLTWPLLRKDLSYQEVKQTLINPELQRISGHWQAQRKHALATLAASSDEHEHMQQDILWHTLERTDQACLAKELQHAPHYWSSESTYSKEDVQTLVSGTQQYCLMRLIQDTRLQKGPLAAATLTSLFMEWGFLTHGEPRPSHEPENHVPTFVGQLPEPQDTQTQDGLFD